MARRTRRLRRPTLSMVKLVIMKMILMKCHDDAGDCYADHGDRVGGADDKKNLNENCSNQQNSENRNRNKWHEKASKS